MELYPLTVEVDTSETHAEMFARVLRSVTALLRRAKPGESPDTPFEVVVNVLTARYGDFAGMPATSEWMRSGHVDPTHQLRVQVFDYEGAEGRSSMRWELDVNDSLSADDACERLPRHFGRILHSIVAHPDDRIGSYAVVDAAEVDELALLSPHPGELTPAAPVHRAVRDLLRADPDRVVAEHRERRCHGIGIRSPGGRGRGLADRQGPDARARGGAPDAAQHRCPRGDPWGPTIWGRLRDARPRRSTERDTI